METLLQISSLVALLGAMVGLIRLSWHGTLAIAARDAVAARDGVKGARNAYYFSSPFIGIFILTSGTLAGWNVPLILGAMLALATLIVLAHLFASMAQKGGAVQA